MIRKTKNFKDMLQYSFIFKLYFIDYAFRVVLISSFYPRPPSTFLLPQAITTPLFMSTGHAYNFFGLSFTILYFTSPWLFSNYQSILINPLIFSTVLPKSPPIWPPSKHSPCPWFCLCSCLLSLVF